MPLFIYLLFIITALLAYLPKQIKALLSLMLLLGVISAGSAFYVFCTSLLAAQPTIGLFSAFMGALIVMLYFFTVLASHRYIAEEYHEGILSLKKVRLYFFLLPLFALAMLTVITADNLGLLWLALETTTLVTTPLVAIYKKDGSLEAAWKYMILCSLGISLGLLGVLLISYAGVQSGLSVTDSLSLSQLMKNGPQFFPALVKWAFLFTFVGLGTKVGFFPLHTWLPDAHGRTPSPISAMLSGILLNVALYALLRTKGITDAALGSSQWTDQLFLFFGLASVLSSAAYLFIQRNYKRMLAYSSMEHMGLIAVAIGLGPLGLVPATMHMLAHTLAKSLLFYGSGEILLHTKTAKIDKIKDLIHRLPKTVVFFTLGLIALLAFPPFATFFSEITLLSVAINQGKLITFFLIILSLAIICVSMFKHSFYLFCPDKREGEAGDKNVKYPREKFNLTHLVMLIELALLMLFGFWMWSKGGMNFFTAIANAIYH